MHPPRRTGRPTSGFDVSDSVSAAGASRSAGICFFVFYKTRVYGGSNVRALVHKAFPLLNINRQMLLARDRSGSVFLRGFVFRKRGRTETVLFQNETLHFRFF